jgi:hypothetical protein
MSKQPQSKKINPPNTSTAMAIACLQNYQRLAACSAGFCGLFSTGCFFPHSGQNLTLTGILFLHRGQIFNRTG